MEDEAEGEGDAGGALLVHDRRHGRPHRTHRFTGWQAAALRRLEDGRTEPALHRLLTGDGHDVPAGALDEWLRHVLSLGLLFRDGRTYVALPTRDLPVRIDRGPADSAPAAQAAPG
jgi:hypothetical protein